ncbi:hypothetical protein J6590_083823 [Homalodisca vitripennis]|nr:hypothetical protein J6590_083823 [Homalodisca vitripennis]
MTRQREEIRISSNDLQSKAFGEFLPSNHGDTFDQVRKFDDTSYSMRSQTLVTYLHVSPSLVVVTAYGCRSLPLMIKDMFSRWRGNVMATVSDVGKLACTPLRQ